MKSNTKGQRSRRHKPRFGTPEYVVAHKRKRRIIRDEMTKRDGVLSIIQEKAAVMLASGEYTRGQVAKEIGVTKASIDNWRMHDPLFVERMKVETRIMAGKFLEEGLALKGKRIQVLTNMYERIMDAIEARGNSMPRVPGGSTGLVSRTFKSLGSGDNAETVEEHEIDTATVREIRAILRDVAEELGQVSTKNEITGPGGAPLDPPVINVNFVAVKHSTA